MSGGNSSSLNQEKQASGGATEAPGRLEDSQLDLQLPPTSLTGEEQPQDTTVTRKRKRGLDPDPM